MNLEKTISIRLPESLYLQLVEAASNELTSTSCIARRSIMTEVNRIKKEKENM